MRARWVDYRQMGDAEQAEISPSRRARCAEHARRGRGRASANDDARNYSVQRRPARLHRRASARYCLLPPLSAAISLLDFIFLVPPQALILIFTDYTTRRRASA